MKKKQPKSRRGRSRIRLKKERKEQRNPPTDPRRR